MTTKKQRNKQKNDYQWPKFKNTDRPIKGVILVTTANAILPVDRDHSMNTDS